MSTPQATDLDALFDAMTASIADAFPDVQTVRDHVADRGKLPTPAVLIDMDELDAGDTIDPGSEQLELVASFEARIIIGFRTDHAKREIRKLATAIAHHIHMQRWNGYCGAAQVVTVEPDAFDPDLDRYEVYRIDWRQPIIIGESVWNNDGDIPTTILVGYDPDIGEGHEDDYTPVVSDDG